MAVLSHEAILSSPSSPPHQAAGGSGWLLSGVVLGIGLVFLVYGAIPGCNVMDWRFEPFSAFGLAIVLAPVFLFILIRAFMAACAFLAGPSNRARGRHRLFTAVFPAICLVLLWHDVPLRIGFWLHRPALEELAKEALRAPQDKFNCDEGRWAGLYSVRVKGPVRDFGGPGRVSICLLTSGSPRGPAGGLLYCPACPVGVRPPFPYPGAPYQPRFMALGGGWYKFLLVYDD